MGCMNLEAVLDVFKACHEDFSELSSKERDYDRKYRFILFTGHLDAIIEILSDIVRNSKDKNRSGLKKIR